MDIRAIVMGVSFALMWSSAFTSAKIIVASAPPIQALSLRFLISGLLAVGLALLLRQSWRLTRAQWRATIIFGICQNALYLGLNFVAMQEIEASLAAIIAASLPLLVALAGWLFFSEVPKSVTIIGLLVGFAGVGIIMGGRLDGGVSVPGLILCVLGVLALTVATLSLRGASSGGNFLMVVGLQMLVASLLLAPVGLMFEDMQVQMSTELVLAFGYTTLVPGLLATLVWFHLVNRIGAVRAATFHFLNPFFGVAVAALFLEEVMTAQDLFGVALVTFSILVVQISRFPGKTPLAEGGTK